MLSLVICFLSLRLCAPVDISPAPDTLSPQKTHATLFPDNGIGIHACYDGHLLWDVEADDLIIFGDHIYRVGMVGIYSENTSAGKDWDMFVFTCYRPDWETACFHDPDGWDRFIIGAVDINDIFPIRQ